MIDLTAMEIKVASFFAAFPSFKAYLDRAAKVETAKIDDATRGDVIGEVAEELGLHRSEVKNAAFPYLYGPKQDLPLREYLYRVLR